MCVKLCVWQGLCEAVFDVGGGGGSARVLVCESANSVGKGSVVCVTLCMAGFV